MKDKILAYKSYIKRFVKSQNKKTIIKELVADIKSKGIITGIRSILYKKSHHYFDNLSFDTNQLSILDYDRNTKQSLSKTDHPKVSIIIPMYNEIRYTYNCVSSILANNEFTDYEVIIADDNSTENTEGLKENFENIVIAKNEKNLGFLKNCNHAATKARGKYLVFLNNDTQVQKNWLAELLYIFEHYEQAGLVGSKLIYANGSLQEAGGIIWQDGSGWNYGNGDQPSKPQYNYVKEVDYISGASVMILKKLWDEIGGFDERYSPAYYEDTDMCFEVRKRGYKVIYQPFSKVVHFEGVSHGTDLDKGVKQYQVINHKKFLEKWRDVLSLKSKGVEHIFSERDRSTGKKHVLVVDHYLPMVDKDAGSRCISSYMDALLQLGYNVKFLGENAKISRPYMKEYQLKGIEILYGNEYDFSLQSRAKYLKINFDNYDAILLSRATVCAPVMSFLRKYNYKGTVIYFGHDLGYLRMEKEAIKKNDSRLLKRAKKAKAKEDYMYQNADTSIVISQEEIEYLKKYILKPLHYIPLFSFKVEDNTPGYEQRDGLLFVGGFNHPPNGEAMKWFLDEIYEPLHKQNIKLAIVGSQMPDFIYKYKAKFNLLTILPDVSVDELNELYSKTKVAIVPLKSGAGVKGKVIESMAKGVPVCGTDVAFEGMPKGGQFAYKGFNTAADIIENILHLNADKGYWTGLSDFGKKYVSENFNKENIEQVFKGIIG